MFFINFIFLEFVNSNSLILEQIINFKNMYEIIFFIFFIINFNIFKKEKFNFNLDIITKYFIIFLKKPAYFFNYIFIIFKKIYKFFFLFKYKFFIDTNKIILRNFLKKINLIWRPLFKKFSYFGYYRSNRSKWIK